MYTFGYFLINLLLSNIIFILVHTNYIVKSIRLYLFSAFNNTKLSKQLHNIKIGKEFVNNVNLQD